MQQNGYEEFTDGAAPGSTRVSPHPRCRPAMPLTRDTNNLNFLCLASQGMFYSGAWPVLPAAVKLYQIFVDHSYAMRPLTVVLHSCPRGRDMADGHGPSANACLGSCAEKGLSVRRSRILAVSQILTARPTHELGVWECRVAADPRGIPATKRLRATWPQTRKQGSRSLRSGSWTTRTRGQVSKPRPRRERLAAVKRAGWTSQRDSPTTLAGALCTKGLLHSTWKEVVPD